MHKKASESRGFFFMVRYTIFKQIREKVYVEPYRAETRPVWLIALSFDSKTRELVGFGVEKF